MTTQQEIVVRLLTKTEQKDMFCINVLMPPISKNTINLTEMFRSFENDILSAMSIPANIINPPSSQYRGIRNKQDIINLINLLDQEEPRPYGMLW